MRQSGPCKFSPHLSMDNLDSMLISEKNLHTIISENYSCYACTLVQICMTVLHKEMMLLEVLHHAC